MSESFKKPPLGVMQKDIWDKKRYDDLCKAIGRFVVCGVAPLGELILEAQALRREYPEFP